MALSAARVEVQLDLWAALLGEVRVQGLDLVAPTLRLRRGRARLEIDAPVGAGKGLAGGSGAATAESRPWYEALAAALPRLHVTAGRVVVVDGIRRGRDLAVESLEGSLERRWLRGGIAVEAAGSLRAGGDAAGSFQLEGAVAEKPSFRLAVEELDLAAAATLVGSRAAELAPRGRATGTLHSEGGRLVSVDLRAGPLHVEPSLAGRRMPLDLTRVTLEARSAAGAGGGVVFAGEARLGRVVGSIRGVLPRQGRFRAHPVRAARARPARTPRRGAAGA